MNCNGLLVGHGERGRGVGTYAAGLLRLRSGSVMSTRYIGMPIWINLELSFQNLYPRLLKCQVQGIVQLVSLDAKGLRVSRIIMFGPGRVTSR